MKGGREWGVQAPYQFWPLILCRVEIAQGNRDRLTRIRGLALVARTVLIHISGVRRGLPRD